MRAALLTSLVALSLGLSSLGVGCVSQKQQERAAARVELGSALLGEGNAPGAIGALEESVDLDPRNWEAWNKLGLAYAARGAPDKAMKALKKAARLAPKNAEALNNYGWLLIARGEYAEAIPVLEKAREDYTYRKPSIVLSNLGFAYLQVGKIDQSLPILDEAVMRAPNLCTARFNRGLALHAAGKTEKALHDFDGAIELCGDRLPDAWFHAAKLMLEMENRAGACEYLRATVDRVERGSSLSTAASTLAAKEC